MSCVDLDQLLCNILHNSKRRIIFTSSNQRAAQLDKLCKSIMATNSTPRTLADLKHQDWVIDVKPQHSVEVAADHIFSELFTNDDRPVTVNFLFQEDEANGDIIKVYEAYKDSGSVDYLYLKKRV